MNGKGYDIYVIELNMEGVKLWHLNNNHNHQDHHRFESKSEDEASVQYGDEEEDKVLCYDKNGGTYMGGEKLRDNIVISSAPKENKVNHIVGQCAVVGQQMMEL